MGCTNDPAVGVYGKLLLEPGNSPYTFDASSTRLEILPEGGPAENFQKHGRHIGGQGIWGGLYPLSTRVREGAAFYEGSFAINPSPGYMEILLPYLVGDLDTGVYYPNNCPAWFGLLIYRDDHWEAGTIGWEFLNCRVAWWELRSRAPNFREDGTPDLFTLRVHVIGKSESRGTTWPSPEPALPEGESYAPYIFSDADDAGDGTVTINGAARDPYTMVLRYDNGLRVRYAASASPSIFSTGRKITWALQFPWDSAHENLYNMAYAGAAASLKLAYSVGLNDYSTLFSFANFKAPPESPFIKDENEVFFTVEGQAYGLASAEATTKEFSVTNVSVAP